MTRRDNPGSVSAEEVSKGCRRIVGFLFAGWFLFGLLFSFLGDGGFGSGGRFDIGGILNIAIPIAIFAFIFSLVAKRSRERSKTDDTETETRAEAPRRVESIRTEPSRPSRLLRRRHLHPGRRIRSRRLLPRLWSRHSRSSVWSRPRARWRSSTSSSNRARGPHRR